MPETSIDRVASAVGALAEETRSLVAEVRTENDDRKRQNRLTLILIALVLIGVIGVAALLVQQRQDTAARSQVATEQRVAQLQLAEQINDCISPQGECYQRSQARQAEVIMQLISAFVAVERCGVSAGDDVAAYDACVKRAGVPTQLG